MADEVEKVQQFITVTGAEEDRAKFFLESSNWDIDSAVSRFLDGEILDENAEDDASIPVVLDSSPSLGPTQSIKAKAKAKPKKSANARFGTLHTLDSSSDDEEDGQAFYAGGSEHSGQQVLGPSKKKKDFVADMFKSVKDHGVEVVDDDDSMPGSSRFFRGTGYKLGQNDNDTEVVAAPPEPSRATEVSMKLWRDGFSIDDGPMRPYLDQENREFMESIRRGEIPQELRQGTSSEVNLSMEDHRGEEFKQAVSKAAKAFTGKGHTLGNPTPPTVGAPDVVDQPVNEAHAREVIAIDPSLPTTNLQIRLADGSRLLGEFNHEHTVAQDSQTIKDAGILNSAIMQKLN